MNGIDWVHLFFRFDGRINRAKIWLGGIILWVVQSILILVFVRPDFGSTDDLSSSYAALSLVYLVALWPSLAIAVKRWHDRDKSGWWVLIVLIPIIGPIWAFVELGFLQGTPGDNQYGPDPLGQSAAAM